MFESSEMARIIVGDRTHAFLVQNKREEWRSYQTCVSSWETDRYLEVL